MSEATREGRDGVWVVTIGSYQIPWQEFPLTLLMGYSRGSCNPSCLQGEVTRQREPPRGEISNLLFAGNEVSGCTLDCVFLVCNRSMYNESNKMNPQVHGKCIIRKSPI